MHWGGRSRSTRVLRWPSTAAGSTGFASRVVRIPSERVYVAVLSNNGASRPGTVARQLAALAIGRPFKDPLLAVVPVPTLEEYVGELRDGRRGADQGRDARSRLTIQQHGEPMALSPSATAEFFEPEGVLRVSFRPDAATGGMSVHAGGLGRTARGSSCQPGVIAFYFTDAE